MKIMSVSLRNLIILMLLVSQPAFGKSFNGFDLSNSVIDKKYIVQGGPPRDSIPDISKPNYGTDFVSINDYRWSFLNVSCKEACSSLILK